MADIQLRFGKDLLVIGSPVQNQLMSAPAPLEAPGEDDEDLSDITGPELPTGSVAIPTSDTTFDTELALILEPEVFEDAYALEKAAGAQCLVAPTASLTPARLAHTGMQDAAEALARTALAIASAPTPEHVLIELGPCGLPLDAASKASLLENRAQYERAARLFDGLTFDAFFLNSFTSVSDLKCALMGIRKVSDAPVLASVDVNADGMLCPLEPLANTPHLPPVRESLEEAVAVMAEFGANAAGFCTAAGPDVAAALATRVAQTVFLPLIAQLFVKKDAAQPDDAFDAALKLANAGMQFVRAAGSATPAYTGAMAAAVIGLDVAPSGCNAQAGHGASEAGASAEDPAQRAERLRRSVNNALGLGGTQ